MKYWILFTANHVSDLYILPEGDIRKYEIAPSRELKKGDMVYLWWHPHNEFYGRGIVVETPMDFEEPENDILRKKQRHRQSVTVNRIQGFDPRMTERMMQHDRHLRTMIPTGYDDLYVIELRASQAYQIDDYVKQHGLDVVIPETIILSTPKSRFSILVQDDAPDITLQALLTLGDKTKEGQLVQAVGIAWFEIVKIITRNPESIYSIDPRTLEEIIAGAWEREGYKVILTPRSGDGGIDVIATMDGVNSIRIYDQIKRYKVTRPVTADEVRALVGTLNIKPNVSKGMVTTTSTFAPELYKDKDIMRLVPYRLDLRPRDALIPWLEELANRGSL